MKFSKILFVLFVTVFSSNATQFSKENTTIVIIGAGPSGIAAASKLWQLGVRNFQILEAENRTGGRIHSVKFGDALVDLGAQWCHGESGNIVYNLVKDLNILKHMNFSYKLISSNGEYVDDELSSDIFKVAKNVDASEISSEYANSCQNVSSTGECALINFNQTLLKKYKENPQKIQIVEGSLDWLQVYMNAFDASFDWTDLYIKSEYKRCGGDLYLSWNGLGYKTILDVLLKKIPDQSQEIPLNGRLHLNTEVVRIADWDNDDVRTKVETKDGRTFEADIVLFTSSAGVLKHSYESLFEPNLPSDKVDGINAVGFGAILKIVVKFDERWWQHGIVYYNIWTNESKERMRHECHSCVTKSGHLWLTNLVGWKPQGNNKNIISGWFAGEGIQEIEQLQEVDIIHGVEYAFQTFFGKIYNISKPIEVIRTTWYSNPHFRGSYSYESARGCKKLLNIPDILAKPLKGSNGKPSIFFAGEATHPYYFSTVHGAIETGFREAENIYKIVGRSENGV